MQLKLILYYNSLKQHISYIAISYVMYLKFTILRFVSILLIPNACRNQLHIARLHSYVVYIN